jgi:hypothetical protein
MPLLDRIRRKQSSGWRHARRAYLGPEREKLRLDHVGSLVVSALSMLLCFWFWLSALFAPWTETYDAASNLIISSSTICQSYFYTWVVSCDFTALEAWHCRPPGYQPLECLPYSAGDSSAIAMQVFASAGALTALVTSVAAFREMNANDVNLPVLRICALGCLVSAVLAGICLGMFLQWPYQIGLQNGTGSIEIRINSPDWIKVPVSSLSSPMLRSVAYYTNIINLIVSCLCALGFYHSSLAAPLIVAGSGKKDA